jgi:large subunit ribosomal protein L29
MKPKELWQKDKKELEKLLKECKEKLQKLRFDLKLGKLKNYREIRNLKKDIARILTIICQKKD